MPEATAAGMMVTAVMAATAVGTALIFGAVVKCASVPVYMLRRHVNFRILGRMLAGESFAGKSTLAYACARSGWTYVSDDSVLVVRAREDRYAIGDPHSIRFRIDAPQLFPELADRMPIVRPNGKVAIEVRTAELGLTTVPGCQVEHIVVLTRERSGPACLRPVSKEIPSSILRLARIDSICGSRSRPRAMSPMAERVAL